MNNAISKMHFLIKFNSHFAKKCIIYTLSCNIIVYKNGIFITKYPITSNHFSQRKIASGNRMRSFDLYFEFHTPYFFLTLSSLRPKGRAQSPKKITLETQYSAVCGSAVTRAAV